MPTSSYTVYLLKNGLAAISDALDPEKQVVEHSITGMDGISGSLFLGRQNRGTPEWVEMVRPFLATPVDNVISASRSAVMIVLHGGHHFAFVFGHGKSLLKATAWERDFGLKVTLNRVDPDGLRSIDSKTYEDLVVSTRRQTSRSSSLNSFDLDVARALVRGVTGNAPPNAILRRLTGSDSLRLSTDLTFSDLPQLLTELLAAYVDTAYQANFGWIDNIREADSAKHPILDALLIADLATQGTQAYLAPAEVVSWDLIEAFNFTGGNGTDVSEDLLISTYLSIIARRGIALDVDKLKHHRVRIRNVGETKFENEWSVYDCLIWEASHGGNQYALFDGRWFEISAAYATVVNNYVARITANPITLLDALPDEDEGVYNARVETGDPVNFAMLDCVRFRPSNGSSDIEFCDLLVNSGKLVHVKKRSSSATLSHLFSQGSVACDVFLNDPPLRTLVRRKLARMQKASHAAIIPVARPVPSSYEVVYAVIAKPSRGQWPPRLFFFSAVNLMHHGSRIESYGFGVALQYVLQT
ncbi:MAG: hypothetical protein EOP09_00635 [Proteobacteria bacterium]|nr:MAG: hypothetical protein EOP09_00635 [Pseudomonadota bacterium]